MNNNRDRVHGSESNHEPDETLDQVPAQADPPVAPPSSADEPTLAPESRPASDSWSSPQSETGSTNVTAASEQPTIAPNSDATHVPSGDHGAGTFRLSSYRDATEIRSGRHGRILDIAANSLANRARSSFP